MKHGKALWVVGSMVALAGLNAEAATLAQYSFDSGSPNATSFDPVIGAGAVQIGDFLNDNADDDGGAGFGSSGAFVRTEDTADPGDLGVDPAVSLADAITSGDYFSFTIAYVATTFSISQITFDYSVSASNKTTQFAADLLSSEGDFIDSAVLVPLAPTAVETSTSATLSVTVPLTFTDLTDDVEFRIYLRDNQSDNGQTHKIDNIVVTGTPEPGSLALLGLGSLCMLHRRRRQA